MNSRKSTAPSPTQPQGKNGQVSQRGMLSLVMLLVSMGTLGIAMIGGAKMTYDILGPDKNLHEGMVGATIALAITYVLGWLTAMVGIRVYGNLVLPILINWLMWACLTGICYLYIEILRRLYLQEYTIFQFFKYVFVMIAGLGVLVGLHLVIEGHNLRPFAFPLLFLCVIQLGLVVYRFVFVGGHSLYIIGDLFFLIGMFSFSVLMLAHVGLLDPLRTNFTNYFDKNSVAIRTQD